MTPDPNRPTALIFRKRLVYWSETFIASQANALERYRPVFVGYRYKAEGLPYIAGRDSVVLEQHALSYQLGKAAVKGLGRMPPRWRRALAEHQPTVLHAHFGLNGRDASVIARSFRIPLIVTYHGMDITIERNSWLQRRERGAVFERASRIIAVSEFIAGLLRQAGCDPAKLIVHYIGVDTERFRPPDDERTRNRSVLFVGRIVEKKGLIHLIRAMVRVQAKVPDAELVIAGDGPLRRELEAAASELGVRARFLGVQQPDAVAELMRRSGVMCTPFVVAANGNAEGMGLTAVEAQASGMPIVASPSGGSPEGFVDGETGLLVPGGDHEALASRLLELLENDELRQRFGRNARAHVLARLDLARQTRKLEQIYDEVRRER